MKTKNLKEKTFKEYLKDELEKPVTYEYYDPNGNSSRAVIYRGIFKEVLYQYKSYPKALIYDIKCFEGFETPIGYFIGIPLRILLSPILPISWGIYSYKNAKNFYLREYNEQINNKRR